MTDDANAGHNEAWLLDRANGYGSQKANTISDLHDEVIKYRLDEFAQPTTFVEMNGQKLTTVANPSANSGDAANSRYVDSGSTYVVRTSGNQSVAGDKSFSGNLTVPDPGAGSFQIANTRYVDGYAVALSGNQTITGNKYFHGNLSCDKFNRGTGSLCGTNFSSVFRVTSGFSVSHNAWTNFDWNHAANEVGDDGGGMSSGNDFDIPITGMYILSACITLPVTPCYWAIQWFNNPYIISQESRPIFDNDKINLTTCYHFAAGDVVTLRIYQDSAGSLTVPAHSGSTPCWASATLVA